MTKPPSIKIDWLTADMIWEGTTYKFAASLTGLLSPRVAFLAEAAVREQLRDTDFDIALASDILTISGDNVIYGDPDRFVPYLDDLFVATIAHAQAREAQEHNMIAQWKQAYGRAAGTA